MFLFAVSCTTLPINDGANDPAAASLLRKMSDKLAASDGLEVWAHREIDAFLILGTELPSQADIHAKLNRPGLVRSSSSGRSGGLELLFDQREVLLVDKRANKFAKVDAPNSVSAMIDSIEQEWGLTPPLLDLFVSDPYQRILAKQFSGRMNGRESVAGIPCDRVFLEGDNVDWEVWIAEGDHLPRKIVITYKQRDSQPQIRTTVSRWDLSPQFSDSDFQLSVPVNASKVDLIPLR